MRSATRLLLTFMLLLALPLQGFAAAAMISCAVAPRTADDGDHAR